MSTVVFLSAPAYGHINPTLSLVTELVCRGEQVIYYALEEFQAVIERTGATFRSYSQACPIAHLNNNASAKENPFLIIDLTLEASKWILDNLLPEIRAFQPDYIMHDVFCPWGQFVGQILHLPVIASCATVAFNRKITTGGPFEIFALLGMLWSGRQQFRHSLSLMEELKAVYHLQLPKVIFKVISNHSDLTLVYTSKVFQPYAETFDDQQYKFVGPSPLPYQNMSHFPFEQLDDRPLLYISLGTVYNAHSSFFRTCIEAFAESSYQVVMAIGNRVSRESLGTIPANFIVQTYVPQQAILDRSVLFVTHGGMNSVSDALYRNVPLVVVPQSVDQPWNAKRIVELGAGKMLYNRQVNAQSLRQAVVDILSQPSYKHAASIVGESLRLAGGYQKAADEIYTFKLAKNIA